MWHFGYGSFILNQHLSSKIYSNIMVLHSQKLGHKIVWHQGTSALTSLVCSWTEDQNAPIYAMLYLLLMHPHLGEIFSVVMISDILMGKLITSFLSTRLKMYEWFFLKEKN